MIERTRAGLAAAAANGRKGGRPRKVDDANASKARQIREKGIAAHGIVSCRLLTLFGPVAVRV